MEDEPVVTPFLAVVEGPPLGEFVEVRRLRADEDGALGPSGEAVKVVWCGARWPDVDSRVVVERVGGVLVIR